MIADSLTAALAAHGYRWASPDAADHWETRIIGRLLRATEGLDASKERDLVVDTVVEALEDARARGDIVGAVFLELGPRGLRLVLPSSHGYDHR